MASSLPRPGVQVIQKFRAKTTTVITPTLVPCVVGVCKQVVPLLNTTASGDTEFNSDALVDLPAFFTAKAPSSGVYTGLDNKFLRVNVDESPDIDITFSDPSLSGLSPATVVDQINAALALQDVATVTAVYMEVLADPTFQLQTRAKGQFESIVVSPESSPEVLAAFGIGAGKTYHGISGYNQLTTTIPEAALPDPRDNLAELVLEKDTLRVFFATGSGTGVKEALRTETFLRNGNVAESATVYTTDLTGITASSLNGKTLVVSVDGGAAQTVTYNTPATLTAVASQTQGGLSGVVVTLTGGVMRLTCVSSGATSSIVISTSSTALTTAGGSLTFTGLSDYGVSIAAVDDGNGDAFTPILEFEGHSFTSAAGHAVVVAGAAMSLPPEAGSTLVLSDGEQAQTITFSGAENPAQVLSAINGVVGTAAGGHLTATVDAGGKLTLTHELLGVDSYIHIIGGTALGHLNGNASTGIVAGASATGNPFPPKAGDELWIDGVLYAVISKVAPGGAANRLRVNKQVTISSNVGSHFFIQAKGLGVAAVDRPLADLRVDLSGNATVKHNILRTYTGDPVAASVPMYVTYRALRRDVSALADSPGLVSFDDTTSLESALAPITAENPLGLGLFFALVNGPGIRVMGLGVDAATTDAPFGTVEAYTRAAEFLEGREVYALAPLTHDESVGQVFNTHVQYMSDPEQRGERIVLWNVSTPTHAVDTLVASGVNGDALSASVFDTKVSNISALLKSAGVNPLGTIPVSAGLFLDISANAKRYSVKSIYGSQITLRTSASDFASGTNDDGYYAEEAPPLPLIAELFSLRIRGKELVTSAGTVDKDAVAATVNAIGAGFGHRRFTMTFPDKCKATIGGVEQLLDGFYMNAATAGVIGQQPPQQSLTQFPVYGFTGVVGSNDTFSEKQLNVMAGGGAYIFIQEGDNTPVFARAAFSTDVTSIETRTDSVTKVVDFTAKFVRSSIRNFIGRFNISQGFLDTLGITLEGVFDYLVGNSVLNGASVDNIIQDEDNRDTVLIDTTLDVPIPCNAIKLTLLV